MKRYRLTRQADADLADLYRYGVREFGPARADRYFDSLLDRLNAIANAPLQYQAFGLREGYRRSVHPPHTIYFRITGPGMVEIVRILRGQDPRAAF